MPNRLADRLSDSVALNVLKISGQSIFKLPGRRKACDVFWPGEDIRDGLFNRGVNQRAQQAFRG